MLLPEAPVIDHGALHKSGLERLSTLTGFSVASMLLLASAWFALTCLLEIINFGWRQPMFDQFRMYPNYLLLPFPENALQLENGHRPILPTLVRIAEIQWFSANQELQLWLGGSCAFLMAAILAIAAWREPNASLPFRAACAATACIGIFWLGNARMLLHGNELLHVYLLGVFVLLGALSVHRASRQSPLIWMVSATVCCLCATFCFGTGVAAFPALALVAWYSRVPVRAIGILGLGIASALAIYLWVLPGDEGVRGMLIFRPIESALLAMRWIASPWINGWLGYADPTLYPWMAPTENNYADALWLADSANAIQSTLDVNIRQTGALFIGLCGFAMAGVVLVQQGFRRRPGAPIQCLALTLVLFSIVVSAIIGITRLANFNSETDQVFANRYLPWSCMFWLGLGILLLLKADRAGRAIRVTTLSVALIVPWGLAPTHRSWAGWGEAVYQTSQQAGAAALSDVFDARVFPDNAAASSEDVLKTLDLLERRHLSMFSDTGESTFERSALVASGESTVTIWMDDLEPVLDARDNRPAAHFRGIVVSGISRIVDAGILVALDNDDWIAGYALMSFVGNHRPALRMNIPRKRGFDGYIRDYSPEKQYRLAVLAPNTKVSTYLAPIKSLEK